MKENAQKIIDDKLTELSKSKFRNSFRLRRYMFDYIDEHGLEKVKEHAYDFINEKIAPANPLNDGKQTPTKNHPVFIAQHACACCCRSCLEKWHHIPKGRELTKNEVNYIVSLLMEWINREIKRNNEDTYDII